MNKKQLTKLKSMMTRAIQDHIKNGGKMIDRDFFLDSGMPEAKLCKCPVEILVGTGSRYTTKSYESRLTETLGFNIDSDQMWSFIHGYDSVPLNVPTAKGKKSKDELIIIDVAHHDLWALGAELRKKFKPLTIQQIEKIIKVE